HARDQIQRIDRSADGQAHREIWRLWERNIYSGPWLTIEGELLDIAHDSNDGNPRGTGSTLCSNLDSLADRIFSRPVTTGHRLADDRYTGGALALVRGELATLEEWNAHGPKITGADGIEVRDGKFAWVPSTLCLDGETRSLPITARGK